MDELVGAGYALDNLWDLTPRQLMAWSEVASKRKKREAAYALTLHTLAARGDKRALDQTMKDLQR